MICHTVMVFRISLLERVIMSSHFAVLQLSILEQVLYRNIDALLRQTHEGELRLGVNLAVSF